MSRCKFSKADYAALNGGRPVVSYGPDGRARIEISGRLPRARAREGKAQAQRTLQL